MAGGLEFDIEAPDLRRILDHIKSFDPQLARDLRRQLRRSGDAILADQRKPLAGPLPGRVRRTGVTYRLIKPKTGTPYYARRVLLDRGLSSGDGRGDLRGRISRGLSTRVDTGKRLQGVSIRSSGPRDRAAGGGVYNLARLWEARDFRHPVFGRRDDWVYQAGRPYFWDPIDRHYVAVRNSVVDLISDALDRLAART